MSVQYKRFLKLLEQWPIDKSKKSRDLGEYLRHQLKATFRAGDISAANDKFLEKQFDSLNRICNNYHFNKYNRAKSSSALGLTKEQCSLIISDSALEFFAKEDTGLFSRFTKSKKHKDDEPKEVVKE